MKTIPAGECRQPVVITKKGVPVAKLVPVEQTERDIVGCLEGVMEIVGDIEAPLIKPEVWSRYP